ncbi:hypothetical protein RvY_06422 [Ramazzottius varieornatus]|uniref:ACB domain-containing protein n=1 Tax=Ramazzottius varieornatus TaxID=947166 RepID=A0A1D1V4U9_RAMVA|nr:hypothetical protein RvY_06422 [Ramazzottius varieornatus]
MANNELTEALSRNNGSNDRPSARRKDLGAKFDAAVRVVQTIPNSSFQPSRELALRFYGLYKRAIDGPCTSPKPAFYEVEKTFKWNAYREADKLTEDEAKEEYVKELQKIVEMMSLTPEVSDFLDKLGSFYEMVHSSDEETGALVSARTSQLGNTMQDFKSLHDGETAVRKKNESITHLSAGKVRSSSAPLHDILAFVKSNDSLSDGEEDLSDQDKDTVESELAFHDARSLSEWSETASSTRPPNDKNQGNVKKEVMPTLYPELQSLRRRTDQIERTVVSHAERLLTLELKLDNLSKAVSKLATSANVGRLNVDQPSTVFDKYLLLVTSIISRTTETLPVSWIVFKNENFAEIVHDLCSSRADFPDNEAVFADSLLLLANNGRLCPTSSFHGNNGSASSFLLVNFCIQASDVMFVRSRNL